jgi:hypothetical protein
MSRAKPPSDELLTKAARLRATGLSWAAIGRELRRKPEFVERWPSLDAKAWRRHYDRAVRQIASDVTAESVTALRGDLRGEDEKARRDSASKLLRYGMTVRKPAAAKRKTPNPGPSTAGVRFAKYVESLTPEQVGNLIRELGYVRVGEPVIAP